MMLSLYGGQGASSHAWAYSKAIRIISRAIWITGTLQKLLCRCYICRALWLALPPLETTCCHGFFRGVRKVGRESSALVMENNQHLHFNNQIIKSIYKIYYM